MKLFKILMMVVVVGLAASSVALAADQIRDKVKDQTQTQLKDKDCVSCDRTPDQDRARDRLKTQDCLVLATNASVDPAKARDRVRDRDRDRSCDGTAAKARTRVRERTQSQTGERDLHSDPGANSDADPDASSDADPDANPDADRRRLRLDQTQPDAGGGPARSRLDPAVTRFRRRQRSGGGGH